MRESRSERVAPANLAAGVPGMRRPSLQNTVFSLMVALGCLGLALFFIFFYAEDANHYLYGGIAGLTALGWLVISVRRWSSYRQSVH
ncbi:MAG TPA: hypothetical protein VHD63_02680 [Ktedonobacteraceae bacterium]|nr:hypothetical protein [Ktedonobacteraceae bacterium]